MTRMNSATTGDEDDKLVEWRHCKEDKWQSCDMLAKNKNKKTGNKEGKRCDRTRRKGGGEEGENLPSSPRKSCTKAVERPH
jgi:hypothetical protein